MGPYMEKVPRQMRRPAQERAQEHRRLKDSRGEQPPDLRSRGEPMDPIAKLDEEGRLIWEPNIEKKIESLTKQKQR